MAAIGIDLGTKNCCVAVVRNGHPEVIPNGIGCRTTPSVVSFKKDRILVGKSAKSTTNIVDVVYDIKYFIGRTFSDNLITEKKRSWPFTLVHNNGKLKVLIINEQKQELYTPEELDAIILKTLKSNAESHLGIAVKKAVITVPTYFNDAQRQCTIDAGKLAGFEEVRLLNEPTAAAIAYGVQNSYNDGRTVLVFDLGGGTFDVSIIKYQNNDYYILAIDGNLQLGGDDIDRNIMNYCIENLKEQYNVDITNDKRKLRRLQHICENAKIDISSQRSIMIELLGFTEESFEIELSRETMAAINKPILKKITDTLDRCFQRTSMDRSKIDAVLLVGGSTRCPVVVDLVQKYFDDKVKKNINPDEAVAIGAAVMASHWQGQAFEDLNINLICSHSLGLDLIDNYMGVIIPIYSEIPIEKTEECWIEPIGSRNTELKIYSGENKSTTENNFLGKLFIDNIAPGSDGEKLYVTFTIDSNGILKVTATDPQGKSDYLNICLDKGNLTPSEIEELGEKLEEKMFISSNYESEEDNFPVGSDGFV